MRARFLELIEEFDGPAAVTLAELRLANAKSNELAECAGASFSLRADN
jgi:hypothetical protein